jgi:hypothetical protein
MRRFAREDAQNQQVERSLRNILAVRRILAVWQRCLLSDDDRSYISPRHMSSDGEDV